LFLGRLDVHDAIVEACEVGRPVDLQPREAGVAHDREQPGPRLATQPVEEPVGAQHSLLDHILCVVVVARYPAREVVRRIQVREHHPLESLPALVHAFLPSYSRQSTVAPDSFTTLPHLLVSDLMNPPNCSGVPCTESLPRSATRCLSSGVS